MRGASAPREGGDEQGGCTEAAQPTRVAGDPVSLGNRRDRRRHVVEEPTPLVEVEKMHRVLPRRARRDRRVNPIEKRFTGTNVVERMVIRTGPGRLAQERRVDVRHLRQRAGCAVGEEGIARAADRDVLSAPERQRRHVAEVVAALESPRGQAVPDRRQGREVERVADPVGLAGMLVHAVREGRGHDRAEGAIERRRLRHRPAEEREVGRLIVAVREEVARSTQASASPPAGAAAADRNARRGSGQRDWRRGVDAGMITSNRRCRPERGDRANLNHIVASCKAARVPTGVTFGQRANGGDGSGAVTMTSGISLRAPGAILLISCYELGHQPLGAAWPRAFLERAGYAPDTLDLAVEPLDEAKVRRAPLAGVSAPMHTALRGGARRAARIRHIHPGCVLVLYGLFALLCPDYI